MDDCIFCKIISGEIPSAQVYEDDQVLAFLDITQTTPGHTLLIPKKHVRNVLEMDQTLASETFSKLPLVARAVQKATNALGMNIINNNEEIAGQTVFHAHIHLVPRFSDNDGIAIKYTTHEPDFAHLGRLSENIKKEIAQ